MLARILLQAVDRGRGPRHARLPRNTTAVRTVHRDARGRRSRLPRSLSVSLRKTKPGVICECRVPWPTWVDRFAMHGRNSLSGFTLVCNNKTYCERHETFCAGSPEESEHFVCVDW